VFEFLDNLKKDGKVQHYGVSVEKVEEALKAIQYPGLVTISIWFLFILGLILVLVDGLILTPVAFC